MGDIRLSAVSSLGVLNRWIQTTAGNLTGSQVSGYKGTRLSFADGLVISIQDGSTANTLGGRNAVQVPSGGIAIGGGNTDLRQGAIVPTGNDHHLAIDGDGWFAVANAAGAITYTRSGEFHVDDGGNLVDAMGHFLLGVFNDSRGLVLDDGSSFVSPGPLPVLTAQTGGLAEVWTGNAPAAGVVPLSVQTVSGLTARRHTIDSLSGLGLNRPRDVHLDQSGNLYVADNNNHVVRMVPAETGTYFGMPMTAGIAYTIAGNTAAPFGGDGLPATTTGIGQAESVVTDHEGNLIFASRNQNRVRFIPAKDGIYFGQTMTTGFVYTIAGDGTAATLDSPQSLAVDPAGNVYIHALDITKGVTMVPRHSGTYFGVTIPANTLGVLHSINGYAMTIDADGNLFFGRGGRISVLAPRATTIFGKAVAANTMTILVGSGVDSSDGAALNQVLLPVASGLSVTPEGLYYSDYVEDRVRFVPRISGRYFGKSMLANRVYTIAGTGIAGFSGNGGPAVAAQVANPYGLHANGMGVWVADYSNSSIRFVSAVDSIDSQTGLYTFLDQPTAGSQDRAVATRFVSSGQLTIGLQRSGPDLPLMTLTTVDGTDVPITLSLAAANNRPGNTAYDNARLIADAINAKSHLTGVAVSVVRDRQDPTGKVALVMGHVHRTLSEAVIDFTDPVDPSADLLRTGAGLSQIVTDAQGHTCHTVNVLALSAAAPGYRPMPGDRIAFDAAGQMINLSRGATPGTAPPFATGLHVALAAPANAGGLEKTAGATRFRLTDAAGRVHFGFAGQESATAIDPRSGIQRAGASTVGSGNRLVPQALEASNTSITDQLPELIIAQKVVTSTVKLIAVGNTLVEDLNGLIR